MALQHSNGRFITIEGSEGGGKSTNLVFVREYLEKQGISVIETREPGGTELGEAIRGLLLGHQHDGMADDTELLLMFAARNEHLARVIRPALAAGQWVLCDRFTDATYAYQGGGRGINFERITLLEQWVQRGLQPDLTLLFDIPVAEGMARTRGRAGGPDRFEQQRLEFFERVRQCYLQRAQDAAMRFRIIDASQTLERVQQQLKSTLSSYLKQVQGDD
jgi:dTMP kinase